MNKADVLMRLKENQNEQGIVNWNEMEAGSSYKSFGIGLTVLRKLAKQVGKDHELVQELWNSEYYDMKVIAVLIDDLLKRRCAYGFIYELSKSKKKGTPSDDYYFNYIKHIDKTFAKEDKSVHLSLGAALMGIGKWSLELNQAAIKVAKTMGPIPV